MVDDRQASDPSRVPDTSGGVDITPLYRAAAKSRMIFGVALIGSAVVLYLTAGRSAPVVAVPMGIAGVVTLVRGIALFLKYR